MEKERYQALAKMTLEQRLALIPEPSDEEKRASAKAAREESERIAVERRRNAFPILEPGDRVRTDIYGFRGLNARIVADPGPADQGNRKVQIEKAEGRNAGEKAFVTRDRVRFVPGQ